MEDTSRIHTVSSSVSGAQCPICKVPVSPIGDDSIDTLTNHLLEHGWTLLHVGQETTRDMDGKPWHQTVAVLGEPQ